MNSSILFFCSLIAIIYCSKLELEAQKSGISPKLWWFKNDRGSRIIGGQNAKYGDRPFQCAIIDKTLNPYGPVCGCTILNETVVVTAAHCGVVMDVSTTRIVYNTIFVLSGKPLPLLSQKIKKILVHPQYNDITVLNDIALIVLEKPFKLNRRQANAVKLPPAEYDPPDGTIVTASGWGLTNASSDDQPKRLQRINLPTYNRIECRALYGDSVDDIGLVSDSMICAGGSPDGNQDICSGDSGGPLTIGSGKEAIFIGIVSKGTCGYPGAPAIYTLVSSFIDFIRNYNN